MKRTGFFWAFLMAAVWAGPGLAAESAVHDTTLTTTDKECALHYITRQKTTGWFLSDVSGSCTNGWLEGPIDFTIRNAFSQPVESGSGFYSQGFHTEPLLHPVRPVALFLSDEDTQTLTYEAGQDSDIRFVGQGQAAQLSDGSFGPFLLCQPIILTAIARDESVFEDEETQAGVVQSAIARAKTICPEVDQIRLYGSVKENPENADIAFFADIRLSDKQIKVKRVPSSNRVRDILKNPDAKFPKPRLILQKQGTPIVQVKPVKPTPKPQPIPAPVITPQPQENLAEAAAIAIPDSISTPASASVTPEALVPQTALDSIPNLLTASRILKAPVDGQALVHVAYFDDAGSVTIDKPVFMRAQGSGLSLGWGIATGAFRYHQPQNRLDAVRGFIQVQHFTPQNPDKEF